MLPLILLTSLLTTAVAANDHPAGHADGAKLAAATSSLWTTIYLTDGVTATMVLPIPASTAAATLPVSAPPPPPPPPPAVTPPIVSPPPLASPTLAKPTIVTAVPPTVVTAAAGQVVCDGSVMGMVVACGLGLLAL
ncbi:hypothetical protein MCOR27_009340 [Pyricularia oryzae]|uniref:Uncharacterized protein n=5 Tax=Pyricularia TaxID=48558 RepID=A0ABQ8NMX7_PYRGI|nr:uncharacterized protein MGG_02431 [Pyricularia oryzae 70-15]ELQ38501.1 hypothetical protein OOU_Y34scaffold00538g16 [Pyricularia oryzae Y34]KAH8842627.1 hypothetical protein MCOR01_006524 [Pyricularia oryzae]KAI6298958.1 hypothetical protein MCOR33_005013 [Pyricularia grisea]EHA56606.1 hypothetical protein MGG_02431 [Pyricularia oryzae 70-15]KAH9435876.1 hypothetical protein MCOR02_004788 [Pyricularia oryzae]